MILFFLEKTDKLTSFDNKLIKFIKRYVRAENIDYRLIFVNPYWTEADVQKFIEPFKNVQYIFWSGNLTKNNLSIVKRFQQSIVVLSRQTILSINNGFNENDAINHNLQIMYLDEEEQEYNKDWKMAIKSGYYNISQRQILDSIYNNIDNQKTYSDNQSEFEDNFQKIQFL